MEAVARGFPEREGRCLHWRVSGGPTQNDETHRDQQLKSFGPMGTMEALDTVDEVEIIGHYGTV